MADGTISAVPLSFAVNSQRDIHDVEGRTADDQTAFKELREVLVRHGLEKKYGLTLLHKHFDLADDEMMVEYTDIENRTLVSKPEKVGSVPVGNLTEVTWSLDDGATMGICIWRCFYNQHSTPQHAGKHMAEGV